MSQIDITKQYRTRNGEHVRIYAIDAGGKYPVHGAISTGDGWYVIAWTLEGVSLIGQEHPLDLVEVKQRIKGEYWLNIYPCYCGGQVYVSKEDADSNALPRRIACIKFEYDVEEGEGLD